MPVQVNADHLLSAAGGEPQRQNNFSLVCERLGDVIPLWVSGLSLPTYEYEIRKHKKTNLQVPYIAGVSYADENITITDSVDKDLAAQLEKWHLLVTPDGGETINLLTEYEGEGVLILTDGCGGTLRKWRCEGMIPSRFAYGTVSYSADGPVEIQANFAVRKITRE